MKKDIIDLENYKGENTMQGNQNDVVSVMSFDEWQDIRDAMNERELRKSQMERKRMAMYFRRQRLFGLCILLASVLVIVMGHISGVEELTTVALAAAIPASWLTFTKHMVLVDSYYLEYQERLNQY